MLLNHLLAHDFEKKICFLTCKGLLDCACGRGLVLDHFCCSLFLILVRANTYTFVRLDWVRFMPPVFSNIYGVAEGLPSTPRLSLKEKQTTKPPLND